LLSTRPRILVVDPVVSVVQVFFSLIGRTAVQCVRIGTCDGVSGSDI
jgi:hypothetical protein